MMENFPDKYVQEQFKGADGAPAAFRDGPAPGKKKLFLPALYLPIGRVGDFN